MGLTLVLILCAAGSLLVALPISILGLALGFRDRGARRLGLMAVMVSLSGTAGGFFAFEVIAFARRYVMEP